MTPENFDQPFYVVRHGETTSGAQGMYAGGFVPTNADTAMQMGQVDILNPAEAVTLKLPLGAGTSNIPLTDTGREQTSQAAAIVARLSGKEKPTVVYHSHMNRTEETARILREQGGLMSTRRFIVPLLNEQDWGNLLGKPKSEFPPTPEKFGGEQRDHYFTRVRMALGAALHHAKEHGGVPLVVAHKGTIQALLGEHGYALNERDENMNSVVYRFSRRENFRASECHWKVERIEAEHGGPGVTATEVSLRKIANSVAAGEVRRYNS